MPKVSIHIIKCVWLIKFEVGFKPIKFFIENGITTIPTIKTTTPVTSFGKKNFNLCIIREKIDSNKPTTAVIPNINGRPPVCAAVIEADKYDGPQTEGHK